MELPCDPAAPPARSPARALVVLALVVLCVNALVATQIPRTGFVTVDLGAIHLQIVRLAATGSASLPLGPLLAPVEREFFPWRYKNTPPGRIESWEALRGGWIVRRDEQFLIIYPIAFAWLCALLYRAIGEAGPLLIPVASGAIACWATGRLGMRLGLKRPLWAAWLVGLASPLTMYAVLVWGHAPAVAAAAVGWLLLAPGRGPWATAGAGVAMGLAAAFRNEGLLLAAVVGGLVLAVGPAPRWRHALAFACGLALALSGPTAYNLANFGYPLDPTQASRAAYLTPAPGALTAPASAPAEPVPPLAERAAQRAHRTVVTLGECLVQSDNLQGAPQLAWGGALLAAVLLIAVGLSRGASGAGLTRAGLVLASLAGALYVVLATQVRPQLVPGLLLCAPALVPGLAALLVPSLWWRDARLHGLGAIAFLLGCAMRGSPGWQWGARYMLLALPVLAVLAVRALERHEELPGRAVSARASLAFLLALGGGMTVIACRDLASEQAFRVGEQRVVRETGAPAVAFDHWWFPWNNARLALDRELFFVGAPADLPALLDHLTRQGVSRLALVTRVASTDVEQFARAAESRGWRVAGRWDAVLPYGHPWHALAFERAPR